MKGTPAIYLGKIVDKDKFRTNIYGPKGKKKLVESWADFEMAMESGLWFATREDALESEGDATPKPKSKSKPRPKPKSKTVKIEATEDDDIESDADELDEMVYEVKDGQ